MSIRARVRTVVALALGILIVGASLVPVEGWNPHGHKVVAYLAFQHLTPAAKARVFTLLKINPLFKTWIAGLPSGSTTERLNRRAFIEAAHWPDFIKSAPNYVDDGPDGGNTPPNSPSASQNIGYPDHNRHKYWHFIDTSFSDDGSPTQPVPAVNALSEIALLGDALASPTIPDPIKSYDLVWLIHLVGDVHQPLHAAERYRHNTPTGDNGGNTVKLRCASGVQCADNLHAFWDGMLGSSPDFAQITAQGNALNERPVPPGADISDPKIWIQESFDLAQSHVYKTVNGAALGDPRADIDAAYVTRARSDADVRAILAGRRLAALINAALGTVTLVGWRAESARRP
jgi:S1/P1 Nuclease